MKPPKAQPTNRAFCTLLLLFTTVLFTTVLFTIAAAFVSPSAHAWTEKSLESSDPFVLTPNQLTADYYYLDTPLKWSWVPGSFEWVRVDHRFLIPRARVRIEVPAGTPVKYQGKLSLSTAKSVELLVVLSSEDTNQIEVNGLAISIRFRSVRPLTSYLGVDTSCSAIPLKLSEVHLIHSWAIVYCHTIHPRSYSSYSTKVDVQVVWQGEDPTLHPSVNGAELPSEDELTFETSLTAESPKMKFKRGEDTFTVSQALSPAFHPFGVSAGIGPYVNQNSWVPFATIYAAYYFNEQIKVASFTALPVRSNPEVDVGLYLITEQFRGFDERLVVNLLLGAHALSFQDANQRYTTMSVPQGVEANMRDFFGRNRNLTLGGFFYPAISNRSYVNTWLRYGNAQLFLEFNFIHWQEPLPNTTHESRSFGLSVGVPLFRLF